MAFLGKTIDYLLHLGSYEETLKTAKRLRKTMTEAEKILWNSFLHPFSSIPLPLTPPKDCEQRLPVSIWHGAAPLLLSGEGAGG